MFFFFTKIKNSNLITSISYAANGNTCDITDPSTDSFSFSNYDEWKKSILEIDPSQSTFFERVTKEFCQKYEDEYYASLEVIDQGDLNQES